jgi:hypothetical protein
VNHTLAAGALVCWLLAESLGALMLTRWVSSGAARLRKTRPDGMSLPVLASHAGLNLTGMLCWVAFLLSKAPIAAWLALAFMIPAIGLGISTVSIWTPYPVRRAQLEAPPSPGAGPERPAPMGPGGQVDWRHAAIPDEVLARAMEDEAFASKLAEDLLIRNLAYEARTTERTVRLDVRAAIPLAHGVLAIATFLLATLAAISAT